MLTILFCSRVSGNPDGNIENFLDSLVLCGATRENCEVLIKYDSDDNLRPDPSFFKKYDINIRIFVWSRGEGRHSIHTDHFYLFSQHNPKTTFVMLGSDDFTFTRKNFIDDILSIKDTYAFVGYARPRVELYAPHWMHPSYIDVWKHNEGVSLPCMSVRTLECLQNYGWQSNADNWVTLLCILLYANHGLDLWHTISPFYTRNITSGTSGYSPSFNNMEIDGSKNTSHYYYYNLVAQQAKNIFLNITYG